jgi:hypothetical protein
VTHDNLPVTLTEKKCGERKFTFDLNFHSKTEDNPRKRGATVTIEGTEETFDIDERKSLDEILDRLPKEEDMMMKPVGRGGTLLGESRETFQRVETESNKENFDQLEYQEFLRSQSMISKGNPLQVHDPDFSAEEKPVNQGRKTVTSLTERVD